ncbi:MAG: orotidine-5'-phosphate decarboxylase [Candidatus Paceibacterota bacterium]|jgi:orotidine-5'-phosphate decarboxylase
MRKLSPAERLIVAADFKPEWNNPDRSEGRLWVRRKVCELADRLRGTGVYLKVNSALRAVGYGLIEDIHSYGLKVFADLKLFDIGETLETDGMLLREAKPDIVTVACTTGVEAMTRLKMALPETEVLGVTVLTTFKDSDSDSMFCCSTIDAVKRLASFAKDAHLNGLVSSPAEAEVLRSEFGILFSLNTPGVRLEGKDVKGDDQNKARVMTPTLAIRAGADRIVMGRPITQAADPAAVVRQVIREIEAALAG